MNGIPNTRISVLRGESEDAFGDETDTLTTVLTGVLASIHESDQRTSSEASGRLQQLGIYFLRVKHGTDIRIDDRIEDEQTGDVYVIADVLAQPSIARRVDVRCRMRKLESRA